MTGSADFHLVMAAIRSCVDLTEFTSDDVWDRLQSAPVERNVVGKAMSEAHRIGFIEHAPDQYPRKSRRPEAKGRLIQVWRVKAPAASLFT